METCLPKWGGVADSSASYDAPSTEQSDGPVRHLFIYLFALTVDPQPSFCQSTSFTLAMLQVKYDSCHPAAGPAAACYRCLRSL